MALARPSWHNFMLLCTACSTLSLPQGQLYFYQYCTITLCHRPKLTQFRNFTFLEANLCQQKCGSKHLPRLMICFAAAQMAWQFLLLGSLSRRYTTLYTLLLCHHHLIIAFMLYPGTVKHVCTSVQLQTCLITNRCSSSKLPNACLDAYLPWTAALFVNPMYYTMGYWS